MKRTIKVFGRSIPITFVLAALFTIGVLAAVVLNASVAVEFDTTTWSLAEVFGCAIGYVDDQGVGGFSPTCSTLTESWRIEPQNASPQDSVEFTVSYDLNTAQILCPFEVDPLMAGIVNLYVNGTPAEGTTIGPGVVAVNYRLAIGNGIEPATHYNFTASEQAIADTLPECP